MKVAISFHGQPRFYKQAFKQWKRYIDELNADVYIHTWWGEDMVGELYPCAPHAKPHLHDKDMLVHENIIEEIKELYQPKGIEWDSYKTFKLPEWAEKGTPKEHAVFQFYTQYRSKELVKESGIDYDVVIRARMDLHIGVPIPINVIPNVIYTSCTTPYTDAPNDLMSVSDLETFDKLSNVYLNLEDFFSGVKGYKMETYLANQMKVEGITHRPFDATWPTFDMLRSENLERLSKLPEKLIKMNNQIVISIFCLPQEIDELETSLNQLKKASYYLSKKNEWIVDVTLSISDKLTNWKNSKIQPQYFVDKFKKLQNNLDWCKSNFIVSAEILGCVSQRRFSLNKNTDADYFIWLDTDIVFEERTLSYIENTMEAIKNITPYSVITPEIVKVWDTTWDCLVNENFLDKPLDYQKTNDPYKDSGIKGDVTIESVRNNFQNQPRFKFAGGWMTCLSGDLVRKIGVPESFGHYGYEDTFIMWASEKLIQTQQLDIQQFKLKNLVVCENYKYRDNSHYTNILDVIDNRESFKNIAHSNFSNELQKV
jgi:hypothetical protein